MAETSYAIALGSNRRSRHGSPEATLRAAVRELAGALRVDAVSPIVRTPALGPAGRGFANAAMLVRTPLDPPALLTLLKRTERAFGRRRGRRWGARVLDLDILLWSDGPWPEGARRAGAGGLVVPHRELGRRAFVLDPLVRIAPSWHVAPSPRTVRQLHRRLRSRHG